MGGFVHFLGVEGQTAERAQRGRHLQTWLEALPAEQENLKKETASGQVARRQEESVKF